MSARGDRDTEIPGYKDWGIYRISVGEKKWLVHGCVLDARGLPDMVAGKIDEEWVCPECGTIAPDLVAFIADLDPMMDRQVNSSYFI